MKPLFNAIRLYNNYDKNEIIRSHQMSLNSQPAYCATGKSSQWGSVWVFLDFCEIKVYKHSTLVCSH